MGDSFDVQLLRRALGQKNIRHSTRKLYGHRSWAEDLDIVNELGGHTGCVNALSWSTSGNLLASGSDDTYLNVWDYNPSNLARPFTLNTSVSTGHHANIFSVKFMPHSSDRTVVTCAGDSEVRVFDLEYTGTAQTTSADTAFTASTRSRRFNNFFANAKWLSDTNTNARVYRSHGDRAKRIVTESSPYLFLTCSEDGEVRQWDLRLPSSAYPPPRGGRGFGAFRRRSNEDGGDPPPPLISYKKYALDLNSISCASSQPQYIALGGAHAHCFLHDRRMLGRDRANEAGQGVRRKVIVGTNEDEAMGEATRCVKRFAPNNKQRMTSHDHGHITACKISDANPNELVASWSADYIYSFDIVKSPDARDADTQKDRSFQAHRLKNQNDRKRKRKQATTSTSSLAENANPSRRLRRVSDSQEEEGHTALRVRYENGDTEDITVNPNATGLDTTANTVTDSLLTEAQRLSERIARSLVELRRTLFDFSSALDEDIAVAMENSNELSPHTHNFTNVLGLCSTLIPDMEEVIRNWSYPVNPSDEDVTLQNTLRRNRQASWRFVQAAGCLAKVMGGRLQTLGSAPDPRLTNFIMVRPAAHEGKTILRESRFCYDFLKAILCWLDGGKEAVLQAFKRPPSFPAHAPRFFLNDDDDLESFVPKLHEYLLKFADKEKPIIDLDTNRFEHNATRHVFHSQEAAVQAYIRALSGVQLELRHGPSNIVIDSPEDQTTKRIMDKGAAARFWAIKVGRSLLMEAAEGVTFDFVNRAFGGLRVHLSPDVENLGRSHEEINPDEDERVVEAIDVITTGHVTSDEAESTLAAAQAVTTTSESPQTIQNLTDGSTRSETETRTPPTVVVQDASDEDADDDNENDDSEAEASDSTDEDEESQSRPLYRRGIAIGRSRERASVNIHIPYSSHTRVYKGHCNTRTVKDVNYYGPNDEYVVSGSDDGHFFIWDRKTCQIVNILEGDGEVVNVVQGHPYEPMIACSGIDSTVKIFGPGGESREREAASRGIDVANPGGGVHSSLRYGGRRARRGRNGDDEDDDTSDTGMEGNEEDGSGRRTGGLKSRKAMHKSYEITSQNDAERRRGMGDAYLTEGMLARFAAALQRGQIQTIGGQGFGGVGGTIVVDDNCLVM